MLKLKLSVEFDDVSLGVPPSCSTVVDVLTNDKWAVNGSSMIVFVQLHVAESVF